jgi:hypothetical protein
MRWDTDKNISLNIAGRSLLEQRAYGIIET